MLAVDAPMGALDAIYSRRSVRSYQPLPLDRGTVQALLDAAVRAPNAIHEEAWVFAVIQEPALLKRLSDQAKVPFLAEVRRAHLGGESHLFDAFASPEFDLFYDAGTLILIGARPLGPFVVADCWLAAENLMLAARALGLGTCVIGSAVPYLNSPEGKAMVGLPPDITIVAPIIVGVPREDAPPTPRREPEILVWK